MNYNLQSCKKRIENYRQGQQLNTCSGSLECRVHNIYFHMIRIHRVVTGMVSVLIMTHNGSRGGDGGDHWLG